MNKRGEWTLLQVGTILGGILVAVMLILIVYRTTSQAPAEASFLSKDSALLADAMLAAPGEVQIAYPLDFKKSKFSSAYLVLGNSSLTIHLSEPKENSSSPYVHYFVPTQGIDIEEDQLLLSTPYLIKTNKLSISNTPIIN